MSLLFATAGAKIFIGAVKRYNSVEFTAADFTDQTWTEIAGVTDLGTAGDTAELITSTAMNDPRVRKLKGIPNAGSMQLVINEDYSDAGQLALIAASRSRYDYAFKIVFNDAPEGGTPSIRYFTGLVMSAAEAFGQANSVTALNATLEITSNIVRVAAAAGED